MTNKEGNRFGWRSGVLTCKQVNVLGSLYIQDDIVFSDVSAGRLGVTGGIDMQATTSAIGIDLGGTFSTSVINIDGTYGTGIKIAGIAGTGIYINKTANTAGTLKIHCHLLAATTDDSPNQYANEFKGEFLATSGTMDGIASHFHMSASGAGIMRSVIGVAYLDAGKTLTSTDYTANGWLVGGLFEAEVGGALAGAHNVIAGVYAGIGPCAVSGWAAMANCKYMTSLYVSSNRLRVLTAGQSSLILATNPAGTGKQLVDYGLRIETGDLITTGISLSGAMTTGIDISSVGTGATAKGIKSYLTVNNANYGDGYASVEADLTLTGTTAGHTSALSAWVEIITGTANNYVCAQTNGVYEEATGTISAATIIFGIRMQSLLAEAPAESYPFSIISNTNIITALIQCNDASSDLGRITNAGVDNGTLIPLYKDNTGIKYVKIYTHT